jgi:EmrB/QacA subfamily drug resistance transporter
MAEIDPLIMGKKKPETKWLVLAAVMLGTFMAPLDASIVNTVLPDISRYFQTNISTVQWVPTIYLLTISCLILLYGRLGDMLGYKRIFLYGVAGFTVASALCGASQSIWMLIAFRATQGLAAGMLMAVGIAIITSVFLPTERGKAIGIYAVAIAAALSLGPTLGGLIAEYLNWRYVFFVNIPIGVAAVIWGAHIIPSGSTIPGQRLDLKGAATASVFLVTLLLYANRGEDWGWTSPLSLCLLGIAVIFGVLFYWIERISAQPMLNLSLFNSRRFSLASLSALLSFMALYTVVFLVPFYLVFILGYSILKAGLVMGASPIATLLIAPLSGTLSDRIGTRGFTVCGMCIAALGLFLLSELKGSASAFDVAWRLVITGSGMGMFQSPNNSAIMGSVSPRFLGIASGTIAAMRNIGMVIGIAVAGAVLYTVAPIAASTHQSLTDSAAVHEFLSGLRWAFITGAVMAGLAALTSLAATDGWEKQAKAGMPSSSTLQFPPSD